MAIVICTLFMAYRHHTCLWYMFMTMLCLLISLDGGTSTGATRGERTPPEYQNGETIYMAIPRYSWMFNNKVPKYQYQFVTDTNHQPIKQGQESNLETTPDTSPPQSHLGALRSTIRLTVGQNCRLVLKASRPEQKYAKYFKYGAD